MKDNQPVEQQMKTAQEMFIQPQSDEEVIELMQAYAAQQHALNIQVIENRIAELREILINQSNRGNEFSVIHTEAIIKDYELTLKQFRP